MHRQKDSDNIIEALFQAQTIAFAPYIFQATVAAKRLGILKAISESAVPLTSNACAKACNLTVYAVEVVCDLLSGIGVLKGSATEGYTITKTGECLLYDPMTSVNLDFAADVCYKGLAHLETSLKESRPAGLSELGPWQTIYPASSAR